MADEGNDDPLCSSDEVVFFGPVTAREIEVMARLRSSIQTLPRSSSESMESTQDLEVVCVENEGEELQSDSQAPSNNPDLNRSSTESVAEDETCDPPGLLTSFVTLRNKKYADFAKTPRKPDSPDLTNHQLSIPISNDSLDSFDSALEDIGEISGVHYLVAESHADEEFAHEIETSILQDESMVKVAKEIIPSSSRTEDDNMIEDSGEIVSLRSRTEDDNIIEDAGEIVSLSSRTVDDNVIEDVIEDAGEIVSLSSRTEDDNMIKDAGEIVSLSSRTEDDNMIEDAGEIVSLSSRTEDDNVIEDAGQIVSLSSRTEDDNIIEDTGEIVSLSSRTEDDNIVQEKGEIVSVSSCTDYLTSLIDQMLPSSELNESTGTKLRRVLEERFKDLKPISNQTSLSESCSSDDTASFLYNEAACSRYSVGLSTSLTQGNVSTVSADEDGGFLMGLTKVALYHAAQNNVDTIQEIYTEGQEPCTLPMTPNNISGDSSDESLNDTLEETRLFEMYGQEYVTSTSKKFKPSNAIILDASLPSQSADLSFLKPVQVTQTLINKSPTKQIATADKLGVTTSSEQIINLTIQQKEAVEPALVESTLNAANTEKPSLLQIIKAKHVTPNTIKCAQKDAKGSGKPPGKYFTVQNPQVGSKPSTPHSTALKNNADRMLFKTPSRDTPKVLHKVHPASAIGHMPSTHKTGLKSYDFIQSPISAYIHNSPKPTLITNKNPPSAGIKKKFFPLEVTTSTANQEVENKDPNFVIPNIPNKTYKSGPAIKMVVPETSRLPHLDNKMQQLIDSPRIIVYKHEGRVKVATLPGKDSPLPKIGADVACHVDDSAFMGEELQDAEVSVISTKYAKRNSPAHH